MNIFFENQLLAIVMDFSISPSNKTTFLTSPTNNLQIGRIQRQCGENVPKHKHLQFSREIFGTHEFLLVLNGECEVSLFNDSGTFVDKKKLVPLNGILLMSGMHEIVFSETCELLEVKQGPYYPKRDKEIVE